MNFELSEEQLAVKEAARDFAQNELLPGVIDRDKNMIFPTDQIKMMGELGFMGMMSILNMVVEAWTLLLIL